MNEKQLYTQFLDISMQKCYTLRKFSENHVRVNLALSHCSEQTVWFDRKLQNGFLMWWDWSVKCEYWKIPVHFCVLRSQSWPEFSFSAASIHRTVVKYVVKVNVCESVNKVQTITQFWQSVYVWGYKQLQKKKDIFKSSQVKLQSQIKHQVHTQNVTQGVKNVGRNSV